MSSEQLALLAFSFSIDIAILAEITEELRGYRIEWTDIWINVHTYVQVHLLACCVQCERL